VNKNKMSESTQNKTSVIKLSVIKSPIMFEEDDNNFENKLKNCQHDSVDLTFSPKKDYHLQLKQNFEDFDNRPFSQKFEKKNDPYDLKFYDKQNCENSEKKSSTNKFQLKLIPYSHVHRNVIVAKLEQWGLDGEEFCRKIKENDCLMAGSFPLQCLLQEFYPDSDIDIFIKDNKNMQNEIYGSHHFTEFETWLFSKFGKSETTTDVLYGILRTHTYSFGSSIKINTIVVDTDNLHNFIANSFDFSFCQTIFDGINVQCFELSLKKIGYIVNQNHFGTINSFRLTQEEHCRGTKESSSLDSSSNLRTYFDQETKAKQLERIEKYQKRGFLFLTQPLIDDFISHSTTN
jgi:hypothetical protein